jgi:hypothetical protein
MASGDFLARPVRSSGRHVSRRPPESASDVERIVAALASGGASIDLVSTAGEALSALLRGGRAQLVCLPLRIPSQIQELIYVIAGCPALLAIVRLAGDAHGERLLAVASTEDYELLDEREAAARLRAALRADRRPLSRRFRAESLDGRVLIDSAHEDALVDGEAVRLSHSEWELLVRLLEEPGRIWTREDLLLFTTRGSESGKLVGPRTIDAHVKNLRRKLKDDPAHPRYIATARGRGYYLQGFRLLSGAKAHP